MNILSPLGFLYGKITDARNSLYDRRVLRSHSLGARTISIGNITAGGTGKTPLVALVSEILAGAGEKVCILTRGYGRENERLRVLVSDGESVLADARTGGDEPVELARKLIGKAVVVADSDRVAAAAWAKDKFGITAFVLDDAFQHRRAERDVDIVCVDATNPFGNGRLLPEGTLRESAGNLKRASAIVVTRIDLIENASRLTSELSTLNPIAPIFLASSVIADPDDSDLQRPAFAFCGVGNPESFFELLKRNGYALKASRRFSDHHFYTRNDVIDIEREARNSSAQMLLTTAKDMVKLENAEFEMPCRVVGVRIEIDSPEAFRRLVTSS